MEKGLKESHDEEGIMLERCSDDCCDPSVCFPPSDKEEVVISKELITAGSLPWPHGPKIRPPDKPPHLVANYCSQSLLEIIGKDVQCTAKI
jgi:hypothetical protein